MRLIPPVRSLQERIALVSVGLAVLMSALLWAFMSTVNANIARREAEGQLAVGERVFQRILEQHRARIASPASEPRPPFVPDQRMAGELKQIADLEVSFLTSDGAGRWSFLASTLSEAARAELASEARSLPAWVDTRVVLRASDDRVTRAFPIDGTGADGTRIAVLQRSLDSALLPFANFDYVFVGLACGAVLVWTLTSVILSRRITGPLRRLGESAHRVRAGDYATPVDVQGGDEIAELAASFNHMLHGISEREARIRRLAYNDPVTDLPNRLSFIERLHTAVVAAAADSHGVAVLLMDLDRFKVVNEALGHNHGDTVLTEVGRRLKARMGESVFVARLGGDEFALILDPASLDGARAAASQIEAVLKEPILVAGHSVDIAGSLGIALYPAHGASAAALLRAADAAMYTAKRARSGLAVFDPVARSQHERQLSMIGELRRAVEQDQLEFVFQPRIDLRSNAVVGAEALLRWNHPVHGRVAPAEFIPFLEQTGHIREVTAWVVSRGVAQAARWHAAGLELPVSLNISPRDLLETALVDTVRAALATSGLPPHLLCLEVVEGSVLDDPRKAAETLTRLGDLGVRIAIDNYGTGYSSLAYLKQLPLSEIKIDRSFVSGMAASADSRVIVRSTIELAHNLGLAVTAEGAEDELVVSMLRQMGCDMAQGWGVSEPLSAYKLERWLKGQSTDEPVVAPENVITLVPIAEAGR